MAVNIMPKPLCRCCKCCTCWRRHDDNPFLLKSPDGMDDQEVDDVAPGSALRAALARPGGLAQCMRHLKCLMDRGEDPLKYLSSEQLSHLLKVGKRFEAFALMARPDFGSDGWSTGIAEESKLWFAYRLDASTRCLQVVVVQDMKGVEPVRAAAGYCSAKLFQSHSEDVQSCAVLAHSSDSALWNQVRTSSDDVVQVDLVNALDDGLGAILIMVHPQPDGSQDFPMVEVPQPCRRSRSRRVRQCLTLAPLAGGSVRMHCSVAISMDDDAMLQELQSAPIDKVARLLRPLVSVWPKRFEAFLKEKNEQLIMEEAFSPHAPFFAVCRAYLSGQAGPRDSSLRLWGNLFRSS